MNTIQGSKYVMSKYGEVITLSKDMLLKLQQEIRHIISTLQLDDLSDTRDIASMYTDKSKRDTNFSSKRHCKPYRKFDELTCADKTKRNTRLNSNRASKLDHEPNKQHDDNIVHKNILIRKLEKDLRELEITGRAAWLWGFMYFSNYLRIFQSPLREEWNVPKKSIPVYNVTLDDAYFNVPDESISLDKYRLAALRKDTCRSQKRRSLK